MVTEVWDSMEILANEYPKKGQNISATAYENTLRNVKVTVKEKRRRKFSVSILLFHDNSLLCKEHIAKAAMRNRGF